MTKDERQQSLANARLACDWLKWDVIAQLPESDSVREHIQCLLAEFNRLDAKEQAQIAAGAKGAEFGKLGAKHGKKGGRPRKDKQGKGSHSYKMDDYEITQMADNRWHVYLNGKDTARDFPTLREARRVLYDELGGRPKKEAK